jgi:hypothetical protein
MASMKRLNCGKRMVAMGLVFLMLPVFASAEMLAADRSAPQCSNLPHMDHPYARISNGDVDAVIFLPDPLRGYYRSSRFDWSGVVACAAYRSHRFWGEWFHTYDPTGNDSITGPVEEFRSFDGGLGYANAAQGGLFVKIGVGVLRRDMNGSYEFGHRYPLVNGGHWHMHVKQRSISFEQRLKSPTGISYQYLKVIKLDRHGAVLTLQHTLKNLGKIPIVTDVYDHDFFMLDGQPTGPGMEVSFRFAPHPDTPLEPAASVEDKRIVYRQELVSGQTAAAYLTGYSANTSDYAIRVEDQKRHFGIEQTGDAPIAKLYLWSVRSTISPEAYIHLDIKPGRTAHWTIHYRLFADGSEAAQ